MPYVFWAAGGFKTVLFFAQPLPQNARFRPPGNARVFEIFAPGIIIATLY